MAAQRGLGRGLSALISESYTQPAGAANTVAVAAVDGSNVAKLGVFQLHAGEYQPRTRFDEVSLSELSESIRKNGVIQPLIVRPSSREKGKYEIIAGERRWRASKVAGLEQVPVIIREISDRQALEFAIVENVQRHDLSPLEEALGYQRLIEEFDYTQEELAHTVGKSRSHIANLLRLIGLPAEVKDMLDKGELTMGHARALLTAQNPVELAEMIVKKGLNVRQAEKFSKGAGKTARSANAALRAQGAGQGYRPPVNKDPDIIALEESLSENIGVRVAINDRGQAGEIILSYDSLMQLDDILRRLGSNSGI
ncbi:MAG: ParB/RepB/Spo0J family partition protein [Alphaproteobacteria bacterium]